MTLIEDFEKRLKILDDVQNDVEASLTNLEELETDIEAAADFREEKTTILMKAKHVLKDFERQTSIQQSHRNTPSDSRSDTKLPKLELPSFSGKYTDWQPFWDKFRAIVDSSTIPTTNKFTYLQSLVTGEAASAIVGLALTEINYENAKDILQKRFGRPERIIFGHIQDLLQGNSLARENSASVKNLWTVYDRIQNHVRSLENLGISGDQYGVFLAPLVLHQLPTAIRLEWARYGEGKEGDLQYLLSFLFKIIYIKSDN